jgi:cupin superfamily acireductone dioxygenase involved in methionine salvage
VVTWKRVHHSDIILVQNDIRHLKSIPENLKLKKMRNWTKEMELVLLSKTANYSNQEKRKYTLLFQESNQN